MKTIALIIIAAAGLKITYSKMKGFLFSVGRFNNFLKRGYHPDDVILPMDEQTMSEDEIDEIKRDQYRQQQYYLSEDMHFWFVEVLFYTGVEIAVIIELTEKFIN